MSLHSLPSLCHLLLVPSCLSFQVRCCLFIAVHSPPFIFALYLVPFTHCSLIVPVYSSLPILFSIRGFFCSLVSVFHFVTLYSSQSVHLSLRFPIYSSLSTRHSLLAFLYSSLSTCRSLLYISYSLLSIRRHLFVTVCLSLSTLRRLLFVVYSSPSIPRHRSSRSIFGRKFAAFCLSLLTPHFKLVTLCSFLSTCLSQIIAVYSSPSICCRLYLALYS